MSSQVLTAATALDTAIATFKTDLATYLNACSTANAAVRVTGANRSNARLDSAANQVFGQLLADANVAALFNQNPTGSAPTLATIHAGD